MYCQLPKIISFSGRKHSGKTELAKICLKYDYVLVNFADSLKDLVCDLLGITREYLEEHKDTIAVQKYKLDGKIAYIANETDIDEQTVGLFVLEPFNSIRSILQVIGTNLIRENNPLWHINKVKKQILENPTKRFCIGDTRFLNEKMMIEELKGECWFIIRPNMFEISNHHSEIALKWPDFGNNVIINNISKELLLQKWENYLECMKYNKLRTKVLNTSSKKELRQKLIRLLKESSIKEICTNLSCSRDKIVWWSNKLMIQISNEMYHYDINAFLEATEISSYVMGLLTAGGCIKVKKYNSTLNLDSTDKYIVEQFQSVLKSNRPICITKFKNRKQVYSFDCNNPFILENIKLWNLKPQKSMNEEIPHLLLDDIQMLRFWIVGLIDGDGSITLINKTLRINILASNKIIDYLYKILPYGKKYRHKNYENLYELNFYNHYGIDLYNWLGHAVKMGLKRKWDTVPKFISLNTKRTTTKLLNC